MPYRYNMSKILLFGLVTVLTFCTLKNNEDKVLDSPIEEIEDEMTDVDLNIVTGHFNPESESSFVIIESKYADREGLYMQKEAYEAFKSMYAAAFKENITLTIKSATRNFEYQKGIWERKWTGETILSDGTNAAKDIKTEVSRALKILEYSSMPGTSRHHWGTDIDLNAFDNAWFGTGEGLVMYQWMNDHAKDYGFCQPYTAINDMRPYGYNEEKWHWSYMPIASSYTTTIQNLLDDSQIMGFLGSSTSTEIGVVQKYMLGINQNCN